MEYAFFALIGLNVFQTVYWSWQIHKLINKLMSRDYVQYSNAVVEIKPKQESFQTQDHDVPVPFTI